MSTNKKGNSSTKVDSNGNHHKKTIIISSEIDDKTIRYNLRLTKELADCYSGILKENPEMKEIEAMALAQKQYRS